MSDVVSRIRQKLIAAASQPTRREPVPDKVRKALGVEDPLFVQGMTGADRDAFEASLVVGRGKKRDVSTENVRAKLAVRCLITEDGARIFKDGEHAILGGLPAELLSPIFDLAQELSGISDEDIDELGKSSPTTTSDTSPIPSPSS